MPNAETVPKKSEKNNPSGVLETGRLGLRTPEVLFFLFFLVQLQHFATLGLVLLFFFVQLQHFATLRLVLLVLFVQLQHF